MILALDTNIIIYAVEYNSTLTPKTVARLELAEQNGESLITGEISRMECLVAPIANSDSQIILDYEAFLAKLTVFPIMPPVSKRAAMIRATHRFKGLDALQLAVAVEHGANRFLTNDHRLDSFTDLVVEVLS